MFYIARDSDVKIGSIFRENKTAKMWFTNNSHSPTDSGQQVTLQAALHAKAVTVALRATDHWVVAVSVRLTLIAPLSNHVHRTDTFTCRGTEIIISLPLYQMVSP